MLSPVFTALAYERVVGRPLLIPRINFIERNKDTKLPPSLQLPSLQAVAAAAVNIELDGGTIRANFAA